MSESNAAENAKPMEVEEVAATAAAATDMKSPTKRTPKRKAVDAFQKESEELLKSLGLSVDLEDGRRRTRSSARGNTPTTTAATATPPSKRARGGSTTPKRSEKVAEETPSKSPSSKASTPKKRAIQGEPRKLVVLVESELPKEYTRDIMAAKSAKMDRTPEGTEPTNAENDDTEMPEDVATAELTEKLDKKKGKATQEVTSSENQQDEVEENKATPSAEKADLKEVVAKEGDKEKKDEMIVGHKEEKVTAAPSSASAKETSDDEPSEEVMEVDTQDGKPSEMANETHGKENSATEADKVEENPSNDKEITEEAVKKVAENDAKIDADKDGENDAKKHTEKVAEKDAVKVAEKHAEKVAEKDAVKVAEKHAEKVTEKDAVKVAEKDTVKVAEKDAVKVSEKDAVKVAEKDVEKVAEKDTAKATDKVDEKNLEKVEDKVELESNGSAGFTGTVTPNKEETKPSAGEGVEKAAEQSSKTPVEANQKEAKEVASQQKTEPTVNEVTPAICEEVLKDSETKDVSSVTTNNTNTTEDVEKIKANNEPVIEKDVVVTSN